MMYLPLSRFKMLSFASQGVCNQSFDSEESPLDRSFVSTASWESSRTNLTVQELEDEIRALENRLRMKDETIEAMANSNAQARHMLELDLNQAKLTICSLERKLNQQNSSDDGLSSIKAAYEAQMDTLRGKADALSNEYNQKIEALEKLIVELKYKLERTERDNGTYEQHVLTLTEEIVNLTSHNQVLVNEYTGAEVGRRRGQELIVGLQQVNQKYQSQLAALTDTLAQVTEASKRTSEAFAKKEADYKTRITALESQQRLQAKQASALDKQIADMNSQIQDLERFVSTVPGKKETRSDYTKPKHGDLRARVATLLQLSSKGPTDDRSTHSKTTKY